MIINPENMFLIVLAIVFMVGAVLQDLRRREVDNVWNFSLIAIAIGYRAIVSVSHNEYWFLLNGIIGFIVFLALGNIFYYSRLFAGGDAKLLIALGTIMPLSYDWIVNVKLFGLFVVLFLGLGSIYAMIWAVALVFKHFSRFKVEFVRQFRRYRVLFIIALLVGILIALVYFFFQESNLLILSVVIILFPFLFVFAKSVEEACMIESLPPSKVTEGDWLYKDVKVSGKKIESNWEGVSRSELSLMRHKMHKNVLVKQGIPFTPSFLFGFLALLYLALKYPWWF